jgi:hypothetical protein
MSSYKKLNCNGTLRQMFNVYLPEAQNLIPPFPYTLYVYVYAVYLFTQGRGEGGLLNQREGERGAVYKAGSKIPVSPVYKL